MTIQEKLEFLTEKINTEEVFQVLDISRDDVYNVYFYNGILYEESKNGVINPDRPNFCYCFNIFFSIFTFHEIAYKPVYNDTYWHITGNIEKQDYFIDKTRWTNNTLNYYHYSLNNCFRTKEIALKNIPLIEKKLLDMYNIYNNNNNNNNNNKV